ncbi:MAG: arsenite methyltransferase [Bacteroidota bacterium]
MIKDPIKKSVVETYGKLAKSTQKGLLSKLFGCCDLSTHATTVGQQIGYSMEELEAVPEGANLGVGCGNPGALASINPGETVVDLGSGAGFDAFLAAPVVGPAGKVIGVDLSDEMLSLARKNARKGAYEQVSFVKGDIEDLPLADNLADHVISNCVINLSLNKGAVYQEAYRILKPGGRISVSDIVLVEELPDFIRDSLGGHIACVSGAEKLDTYLSYVREAGFEDIRIESKSSFPLEIMLMDPQVQKLAKDFDLDLDGEEVKDIASRVISISLSGRKEG